MNRLDARTTHPAHSLFDATSRGGRCGAALIEDTLRCVPEVLHGEQSWREVFADSSCTVEAATFNAGVDAYVLGGRVAPETFPTLELR